MIRLFSNDREIAELLIKTGANVNVPNTAGETPLDAAIRENNEEIAELLRSHGAKRGEELRREEEEKGEE